VNANPNSYTETPIVICDTGTEEVPKVESGVAVIAFVLEVIWFAPEKATTLPDVTPSISS